MISQEAEVGRGAKGGKLFSQVIFNATSIDVLVPSSRVCSTYDALWGAG